eukprot:gnl/MRDRNA2_/MRDRNA2_62164_c0_seq1.p1 gnl/MRDRNA2_/MRDRNA2_62164_c0~~gnl/MRDRNA2_/MRDRNA2_62164_c0_seq1.p1  ORF type:complete len:428 (+),score=87.83 gnl/MRDRNA2_/MRDRNA2_62164_c0_seq1:117-1400(+)
MAQPAENCCYYGLERFVISKLFGIEKMSKGQTQSPDSKNLVVLGQAGAPLPPAPKGSLRDRLPRHLTQELPWVQVEDLPAVDPYEDVADKEHYQKMVTEYLKRHRVLGQLFMGGSMQPPPGHSKPLNPQTAKDWQGGRLSDIIVAVPAKSGTSFVQHICHQLRVGGRSPDFDDQMDVMNWLECGYGIYGSDADAEHPDGPIRVIKSHLPYAGLPSGTKKIYVFRDLHDKVYSLYWFMLPYLGLSGRVTMAAYFDAYFAHDKGKPSKMEEWLRDLVDWWNHRHDPDVLFLFFDELTQQHRRSVERIAAFMGLDPASNASLIETVVSQTTHAAMASTRGPSGKDPFDEQPVADVVALMLGLSSEQRSSLVGKVRKGGGQSGQGGKGKALPEVVAQNLELSWAKVVEDQLGFKNLSEMMSTREKELALRK